MPETYTLENAWYLPSENTWMDFQMMAMKDIGMLIIDKSGIVFRGNNTDLIITQISSIAYGKQGRDFINNWVKIEYMGPNNLPMQAYFADGNKAGWAGIFGGTKRIYNQLKGRYSH